MTVRVRITRTQTVDYNVQDQDLDFYREQEALNVHQAALLDQKSIEEGELKIDDIDGDVEDRVTVELLNDDGSVTSPDESNTTRDFDIFPKTDDEEEDEEDDEPEAPVAGELNAGGEAYGRF